MSEKIARDKFSFDFLSKDDIISLLVKQDEYRSLLCYGKAKQRKKIEEVIKNLYKIKKIIESLVEI